MSTYLLLRNNKESGPHTLQALLTMGLRPYDLVWVEGRSAAWRYPSEVEELKPYAQAVEEQPFDRFYKKSLVGVHTSSSLVGVHTDQQVDQNENNEKSKRLVDVYTDQHQKYMPPPASKAADPAVRKSVFVTMPGKAAATSRPAPAPRPVTPPPVMQVREAEPVEAEIKYSQSLDDIKDMYVQTLQDRKKKLVRRSQWRSYLRTAAVIASLIGVGVLVGFMVRPRAVQSPVLSENRNPAGKAAVAEPGSSSSVKQEVVADDVQLQNDPVPAPEKFKDAPLVNVSTESRLLTRDQTAASFSLQHKTPEYKKNNTSSGIQPAAPEAATYPVSKTAEYQSATQDPHTGQRGKAVRTGDTPVTEQPAANPGTITRNPSTTDALASQVTVRSNDYKRVAFGGIRDLRLTVTNNSNFELDQVLVELQYIKPSEEPLRTEQIKFGAIAANESSTIRIPDTNRGIKVTYRIIRINSKQAQDALAGR